MSPAATVPMLNAIVLDGATLTPAGAGTQALFDPAANALPAGTEDGAFGHDVDAAGGLLRGIFLDHTKVPR